MARNLSEFILQCFKIRGTEGAHCGYLAEASKETRKRILAKIGKRAPTSADMAEYANDSAIRRGAMLVDNLGVKGDPSRQTLWKELQDEFPELEQVPLPSPMVDLLRHNENEGAMAQSTFKFPLD